MIRAQPSPSTLAASCGWIPTAASSHVEPIDAVERPLRRRDVPARDEDPLDAGESGAADDEVDVDLEPVSVEVAVAVDETHPAS